MCTKFGTAVGVADVITCDNFGGRLRGVDFQPYKFCRGSKIPLTKPVAVNTDWANAWCDNTGFRSFDNSTCDEARNASEHAESGQFFSRDAMLARYMP